MPLNLICAQDSLSSVGEKMRKSTCYHCGKKGHNASECRYRWDAGGGKASSKAGRGSASGRGKGSGKDDPPEGKACEDEGGHQQNEKGSNIDFRTQREQWSVTSSRGTTR